MQLSKQFFLPDPTCTNANTVPNIHTVVIPLPSLTYQHIDKCQLWYFSGLLEFTFYWGYAKRKYYEINKGLQHKKVTFLTGAHNETDCSAVKITLR